MGRFGAWIRQLRFRWSQARENWFDARHGVDTSGLMLQPQLSGMAREVEQWATGYYGTIGPHFRRIIRNAGVRPEDFTFIDLGCGKGRTLLLASQQGFQEVIGVEVDAHFAAQARENAAAWMRQHNGPPIQVIEGDAREYDPPAGNLFVYLYNPFGGTVFESVANKLATIAQEVERSVVIAYNVDLHADIIENTGMFSRRRLRPIRFWARRTVSYFYSQGATHRNKQVC